jgi:hypothetical protein
MHSGWISLFGLSAMVFIASIGAGTMMLVYGKPPNIWLSLTFVISGFVFAVSALVLLIRHMFGYEEED